MFHLNVDLGQIIISALIAIIGWLIKRTIDKFESRIDSHDKMLYEMNGNLKQVMGILGTRSTDGKL